MTVTAVSIGDNCIDNYLPPVNKKFAGGNAVNVAVYLSRHNIRSAYVGAVGTDENGDLMISKLKDEGVDLSQLKVLPGTTAVSDITLINGDRVFVREDFGVVGDITYDNDIISFINNHDLAHFSILGSTFNFFDRLNRDSLSISIDFSSPDRYKDSLLENLLPYADYAFFSCPHLQTEDDRTAFFNHIHSRCKGTIVVTQGEKGSHAYHQYQTFSQSAIKTDVLDTLGAGDTFIGVFLANQLSGNNIQDSLYQASLEASKTCTHHGGWLPSAK